MPLTKRAISGYLDSGAEGEDAVEQESPGVCSQMAAQGKCP